MFSILRPPRRTDSPLIVDKNFRIFCNSFPKQNVFTLFGISLRSRFCRPVWISIDCIDFAECMSLILTTFAVFRQRAVLAAAFCFIFMLFFGSMIDIREVGD
jgi:hypothetical protein